MAADFSFRIKLLAAVLLTVLADIFFYRQPPGSTLGLFAVCLLAVLAFVHRMAWRSPRGVLAFLISLAFALVMIEQPSPLALVLWWLSLAIFCLSIRAPADEDALGWAARLAFGGLAGLIGPVIDMLKGRMRVPRGGIGRALGLVVLPLGGGLIFLILFSLANPLIGQALSHLHLPSLEAGRLIFWAVCLLGLWMALRPRSLRWRRARPDLALPAELPGVSIASVGASLVVFNALFAVQNGLDIAFLWSGAPLPARVTLSDYAHRGANTLIAAAVLAGLFVLVALRPGTATARTPWLRALVVLWVAQTLVLVASSILRTLDYVQAYSLTSLRIAALLWMGLVAAGLLLICWRLLRAKSANWLIHANLLTTGLVLSLCSAVDLGAVAAQWNITHAREVGGSGAPLDLCYLRQVGEPALVPLSELLARPIPEDLRDRAAAVRQVQLNSMADQHQAWRGWTWRAQRRMDRALELAPEGSARAAYAEGPRDCQGRMRPPPVN